MQKKLLSIILTLALLVQMFPVTAMAENGRVTTSVGISVDDSDRPEPQPESSGDKGLVGLGASDLALMNGPWDGTTETETKPQQNADGVYQIGAAAELAWFRTNVNNTAACDWNAVLTGDIDLGGYNWTPISTQANANEKYKGTFDGQLYTISGLSVTGTTTNQGLFADINGATIKNLLVKGSVSGNNNYVGGIVGSARGATIENCSFSGSVTYTGSATGRYIGGIVGGNQTTKSTIRGCVNQADVTGYTAGGILGYSTQPNTIENCYNTGVITGSFRSGGIVGQATTGSITSCYNIGEITGASTTLGGIYSFSNATIQSCYHLYPEVEAPGGSPTGKSTKIDRSQGLLALLDSSAFAEGEGHNGGYPILSWQVPPDTTPSISLNGVSTLYVEDGKVNETALIVELQYIEPQEIESVEWTVETAKGTAEPNRIVAWKTADNDEKSLIVTALGGGIVTATVVVELADGTLLEATRLVSVVPQITTAEIRNIHELGAVAMGQTVAVKVFVLGGEEYDYENYPPLAFHWRYNSTAASAHIPGATDRTFRIPTTPNYKEWDKLYVEITSGGKVVKEAADVKGDLRGEDYGKLYPVAYDPTFVLPTVVKDTNPLVLPATYSVDGIEGAITWSSSHSGVIDPSNGSVTPPPTGTVAVTLTARYSYGTAFANRSFEVTVYSREAVEGEANKSYLQQAVDALGEWYGPMIPTYGQDSNIAALLQADLAAKGYSDLSVAVQSITELYDGAAIAPNGDLTYFYADPNGSRVVWFGQYRVAFTLSKGSDRLDVPALPVNIYWDRNRVEGVMREEILGGVTQEVILAGSYDQDNVTADLVLPKVVDNKRWTQIEWTSSDPAAVLISTENQGSADTLFAPYVGKVIRGEQDKVVTLTAKFKFQHTSLYEPEIALYKTFTFTVKALTGPEVDAIRAELLGKLDAGFAAVGLRDYVTGQRLTQREEVYTTTNDLQFPTTRDFGVDGKYFPVTIASSDPHTIAPPDVANAARAVVYRPPVGAASKTTQVAVSITDLARGVSASKSFSVEALPLTTGDLDDALALMDQVKTAYFEGLSQGRYQDEFSVTGGMQPFQEAAWNDDKSDLRWIYDAREATKSGIVADALDNWAEQEAWRAFRSSDMTILDHETLNYGTQPTEDTFVRINSVLTHQVYGKYAGMPGYEGFEQLNRQPVSVYVMAAGKNHPTRTQAELERMREEAIARISAPISAGFTLRGTRPQPKARAVATDVLIDTTVDSLEAGTTVFGLFRKVMAEQGYTYKAVGSYVKSVTDNEGNTLAEGDAGGNSGWIYTVNGKLPSIYMNGYSLKEDDVVVVRFTEDYTQEGEFGPGGGTDDGDDKGETGNGNNTSGGDKPGTDSGNKPTSGTPSPLALQASEKTVKTEPIPEVVTPAVIPPVQAPTAENPAPTDNTPAAPNNPVEAPTPNKSSATGPAVPVAIGLVLAAALATGVVWMKKNKAGKAK